MKRNSFNKVITIVSWTIFIFSIIRILLSYKSLPNELGVHFASDGTFDVVSNKSDYFMIGYPYIMTFAILIISEIIILCLDKIKVGFKITKKGELRLKELIKMLVNITKLCYTVYLSFIWSECMISQVNINSTFMSIFVIIYLIIVVINFILIIKNIRKYRKV